jgi:hypothetical protein
MRNAAKPSNEDHPMYDLIFIGATIAFFAICILYTYACGRL